MKIKDIENIIKNSQDLHPALQASKISTSISGLSFQKVEEQIKYKFSIVWRKTNKLRVIGLNANIYILPVEQILTPILVKYQIIGDSVLKSFQPTIGIYTHTKILDPKAAEASKQFEEISIMEKDDVIDLLPRINIFYSKKVIPFYNKWKDVRDFIPVIENADNKELIDIFGLPAKYKKMIIWKLCGHPKFNSYMNESIQVLEDALKGNPSKIFYQQHLNAHLALKEKLEKITPLYKWDEGFRNSDF